MVHCLSFVSRRVGSARSGSRREELPLESLRNLGPTEMRRLSWLVAPDPFLLGTAQCLLYVPVTRRLIHSAQARTIDLLGRAALVLQAFLFPSGPQWARAKAAIQAKSRQAPQSISPSSCYFRAATMHQQLDGDVR
jgi:hypothetical protein